MKFTAKFCTFQGVPGYMLKQWNDGTCICSQFIPKAYFAEFCASAGICKENIVFK